MAKAYWISIYRAVHDPAKLAAYAKLAGPALSAHGARFLARGVPSRVFEQGLMERTVLIEFDSVEKAVAAHDSQEYREALRVLADGVEREIRIIEAATP